jgi:ATP-dependent helicase/DNAse subunit B
MEEDIAKFFDELAMEDLLPGAFEKIRQLLNQDEFKDERHLERLVRQADELESLHAAYAAFLDKHQLIDAARDISARVKSLGLGAPFTARAKLSEIYLIGFVDATRIQKLLLSHLLTEGNAHFWTHAEPAFLIEPQQSPEDWRQRMNPFGPLAALLKFFGSYEIFFQKEDEQVASANSAIIKSAYRLSEAQVRDEGISVAPWSINIHEATSPLAEVKAAAACIRALVHAHGIAPHQIVVVVPDEQVYGRLVWSVFAEAGIDANHSLGMPLLRTRAGQWPHLMLTLVKEDWRPMDLMSLLHHPFSAMWMDALAQDGSSTSIQQIIETCLIKNEIARGRWRIIEALNKTNEGEAHERAVAMVILRELENALSPFSDETPVGLNDWIARLLQLLKRLQLERWVMRTSGGAYNLDGQALQIFVSALQEMQRIALHLQQRFSFDNFFRLLNQHLFSATVRAVGEPYSGVQAMGLLESRSVPAEVFIVLGNNEGSFPATLGRELFLEEPLRARLGLTTYHKRELLQDQHFYRIAAGAARVDLFYCRMHDDEPRVRSRFLERLLLLNAVRPGAVTIHHDSGQLFESDYLLDDKVAAVHEHLRRRALAVQQRMAQRYDQRGVFGGNRPAILKNFSATTLQMLFHCPYRFLLHTFGVDEYALPTEEADSLILGEWLHRVFQAFFQGLTDPMIALATPNDDLRQPWTNAITPQNRAVASDRLQRLGRLLMTSHEGQEPLFYHMRMIGWPAFVDREIARGSGIFLPEYFEFNIEDFLSATLPVGSHHVAVRGRIDRIFITGNDTYPGRLIDYKLSGFRGSEKSILEADEPQLPLYALALQHTGLFFPNLKWIGEYWSIRRGESKTILEKEENGLAAAFENLLNRWRQRLDQLKSGAAFEAEVTSHCEQCAYESICRRKELFYVESERERKNH